MDDETPRPAPLPVYQVDGRDADERGRIVHADDSTVAEILAQIVELVPEEKRADLMYYAMRWQHARSKSALAMYESWLRTVQRAYLAGRLEASSEAMENLTGEPHGVRAPGGTLTH